MIDQRVDLGNVSGICTLDLGLGHAFTATQTSTVGLAFANVPGGPVATRVVLRIALDGINAFGFPPSVKWEAGLMPATPRAGTYLYEFTTFDGGASWLSRALIDLR